MLENSGSGVELPAAVIVETVQAEGGIKVASDAWLRRLEALCRAHGVLLIVDDIQVGCGRTGTFFSFEAAGIRPDLVCLSKSISGIGLPMALVLIGPGLDRWSPGEHNGTFRGNNLAFVAATAVLDYWVKDGLTREVQRKAARLGERLRALASAHPAAGGQVRGRGLIQGIAFSDPSLAGRVSRGAFARGVVVETAGPADEVLKLLPPLTISDRQLDQGLDRIGEALAHALASDVSSDVSADVSADAPAREAAWA
jgi:diaminobutyrate-2-oxoglutarate transaminase